MKNRRSGQLWFLVALLVLGATFYLTRQHEPGYQGKQLRDWLEAAGAESETDREEAAAAIRFFGESAVPYVVREVRCKDSVLKEKLIDLLRKQPVVKLKLVPAEERRRRARMAFMHVAPVAHSALPDLIAALRDSNPEVRWSAANFLSWIGVKANADAAVPGLIEALRDPNTRVRQFAANALRNIGPRGAKQAVPALIQCLDDETMEVRATAATALGTLGHGASNTVTVLIKALRDDQEGVRSSAAHGLGELGTEATEAVPELLRLVREENEYMVCMSAMALTNIAPEAAIGELTGDLNDASATVRRNAALALYYFGPKAKTAVPALLRILKQDGESTAKVVQHTLANIDPGGHAASSRTK